MLAPSLSLFSLSRSWMEKEGVEKNAGWGVAEARRMDGWMDGW
jgi:hypothetical protein